MDLVPVQTRTRRPRLHIRPDLLRLELALRGLESRQLAEEAGLSESTVSHAMTGKAVNTRTFQRIVAALGRLPKIPGAADLLTVTRPDLGDSE